MDTETIKFIKDEMRELKDDLKDIIVANGIVVRGKIESEVDRIDEMDKKRNGRICENEEGIENLRKETRLSRFAQRNAGRMMLGFVIVVAIISLGAHAINVKRTVERVLRIELNE